MVDIWFKNIMLNMVRTQCTINSERNCNHFKNDFFLSSEKEDVQTSFR